MTMQWYWWLLAAAIGLLIGWLAGLPYKKGTTKTSNLIVNLVLGGVGGLVGALLFLLMRTLLLTQVFGVVIMATVGAIILLWLLARVKKGETDTVVVKPKKEEKLILPPDEFENEK